MHFSIWLSVSLELVDVEFMAGLFRREARFGRGDIAVELVEHFLPGEFPEYLFFEFGGLEVVVRLLDGDFVGFDAEFGNVALLGQSLAVLQCLLRLAFGLAGGELFHLDAVDLQFVGSLEVLLLGDLGGVVIVPRFDNGGLAVVTDDLLLDPFVVEGGGIEFDQFVARLDERSLGNDPEDDRARLASRFHFATDFDVAGAFDITPFDDFVEELPPLDDVHQGTGFLRGPVDFARQKPGDQRQDGHHRKDKDQSSNGKTGAARGSRLMHQGILGWPDS